MAITINEETGCFIKRHEELLCYEADENKSEKKRIKMFGLFLSKSNRPTFDRKHLVFKQCVSETVSRVCLCVCVCERERETL